MIVRGLLLMAGAFAFVAAPARAADTRFECELFGVVLEATTHPGNADKSPIMVAAETGLFPGLGAFERMHKDLPKLEHETFDSFVANNRADTAVDCAGVKPIGHEVTPIPKNLPDGTMRWSFSRAGLDARGQQALIEVDYYCGPLCAGGTLYEFALKDGKWTIAEQMMLYIS
jgi:hypothetical protein